MKKTIKVFGLLLTLIIGLGIAGAVYAADITDDVIIGSKNMKVTFDGKKLDSEMGSIMDLVNKMQPGDGVSFEIELVNTYSKTTDFWMYNKVIKSFEKNSPANGGAYTYILTYTDADGKTNDIFRSDTVGGDEISGGREGMREATSNLEDYFYLFTLDKNENGYVTLIVYLDGETQGNSYQNTLADIDFRFACEVVKSSNDDDDDDDNNKKTPVKTGDDSVFLPYAIALCISGLLLLAICMFLMGSGRNRKGGDRNA